MVSLLQILLLAQHVSGNVMPIIRSSRILYRWLLPVVFGALVVWYRAVGCVSGLRDAATWFLYCRSYCLLNMFRAPLCPSSGAQEYYTVVAACGISCCVFFKLLVWCGAEGCVSRKPDTQLENQSTKYHRQQPLYNTLELLMMGIMFARNILSKL